MGFRSVYLLPLFVLVPAIAVPPEACFANFRWDDCGRSPVPVMYYWKPGSRCEVGLWRGCLPNMNMFPDEYECVTTCIFTARAMPEDYHSMNENEVEGNTEFPHENVTDSEGQQVANVTGDLEKTVGDGGDETSAATVVSVTDGGGGDNIATVAENEATIAATAGATVVGEHSANGAK